MDRLNSHRRLSTLYRQEKGSQAYFIFNPSVHAVTPDGYIINEDIARENVRLFSNIRKEIINNANVGYVALFCPNGDYVITEFTQLGIKTGTYSQGPLQFDVLQALEDTQNDSISQITLTGISTHEIQGLERLLKQVVDVCDMNISVSRNDSLIG
ncbi:MAG: hypothetical protein ACMXYF_06070 [Candidatus Woesearchaeota archaeon]